MENQINQIIIIGSGPSGLTAALYVARARLNPLLVCGEQPGELIATTDSVENFPGFPEDVGGVELALRMEEQAERFGTRFLEAAITRVDLSQRPFTLETNAGEMLLTHTLIIATGASPRSQARRNLPITASIIARTVMGLPSRASAWSPSVEATASKASQCIDNLSLFYGTYDNPN